MGKVMLNGEEIPITSRKMREISGFVFQEDVILSTMTVREAITMSANLRLPDSLSPKIRKERIEEIIEILNLQSCANTKVGDSIKKGISGGERKRTSIAMELITNPPVLFLDEPTSGLDTKNAYSVVKILYELAHLQGRTVIATIHQPSSEIFHMFDDLLLMSQGQILYYGPASHAVEYFADRGFVCPQYTNPSDYFFMHVVNEPGSLLSQWKESKEFQDLLYEITISKNITAGVPREALHQRASFINQFRYLMNRAGKNAWRNRMIIQAKLLQNTIVGIIVGLIYFNTDEKNIATQIQVTKLFNNPVGH
jgi:ABC-type multidrug transport system ATPase subunit